MKKLISLIIAVLLILHNARPGYALRPVSIGNNPGQRQLLPNLRIESDEVLQNIIKQIEMYAEGRIDKTQLISEGGLYVILDTYNRIVLSSRDRKYIVKIYKDESGNAYITEKDFYLNINPTPRPVLYYSNDRISALIIENLNYTRLLDQFGFMQSPTTEIEQIERSVRSAARNIATIHRREAGSEHAHPRMQESSYGQVVNEMGSCLRRFKDSGFDETVDMSFFRKYRALVVNEELVHTHGDYIPWNIFVDPASGEVEALIDAEFGRIDSRVKEVANIILGLIDARKNKPLLISNIERLITIFLDTYIRESGVDRNELFSLLPYYLVCRLIIGADICYSKWQNRDWVRWRLMLAEKISRLDNFTIEAMANCIYCDIDKYEISWAGWIDVFPDIGPVSGKTLTINRNDTIDVYVRVKVKGAANNPLLATNISACIWTDANRGTWHSIYPLEFMHAESDGYLFMGKLKVRTSGTYSFTAKFSTDNGNTWTTAITEFGMPKLVVKTSIIESKSPPQAVVVGDVHAELLGLRESLHASGVVHKAKSYLEDTPIVDNVIFGQVGDLLDRGPHIYETYEYIKLLSNAFRDRGGDGFMLIGNHELDYLRGKLEPPNEQTRRAVSEIRGDILTGNMQIAYVLDGRLVVHGGVLPFVLADIARKIKPDFVRELAHRLKKNEAALTNEEISLARNENSEALTLDEIAKELNIRLIEAVITDDFSDIIFNEGNVHFMPKKRGDPDYEPAGVLWADFDDELMLVDDRFLIPMIVGHKEGRGIRWTPSGKVIDINVVHLYGRGRNSGILIQGQDDIFRAVYSDGRPIQTVHQRYLLPAPTAQPDRRLITRIDSAA